MRRLLCFSIILVTITAGASSIDQEFTVTDLQLEGDSAVVGRLAVLHLEGNHPEATKNDHALQAMTLHGEAIRVDTGHSATNVTLGGAASVTPSQGWMTSASYQDSSVEVTNTGERFDFYLAPADPSDAALAALWADRLHLQGSGTARYDHESPLAADPFDPVSATTASRHRITDAPQGTVEIEGDFLLVLWDTDVQLSDAQGNHSHWSGERSQGYLEESPDNIGPSRVESRELRIHVQDGSLRLHVPHTATALYFEGHNAWAERQAELTDAISEQAEDPAATVPRDVELPGPIQVGLAASQDGRFGVGSPRDSPAQALLSGQAPAGGATVAADVSQAAWWTAVALSAAILLAAAVSWRVHRGRQQRLMDQLSNAMEAADYQTVASTAHPLLRSRRFASEVVIMLSVALLRLGRSEQAIGAVDAVPPSRRPQPAACSYLRACALVQMGRRDEARTELEACLQADQSFATEIMNNPEIASLLRPSEADPDAGGYA